MIKTLLLFFFSYHKGGVTDSLFHLAQNSDCYCLCTTTTNLGQISKCQLDYKEIMSKIHAFLNTHHLTSLEDLKNKLGNWFGRIYLRPNWANCSPV